MRVRRARARRERRRREPWFAIYGHMPNADHVLCAMVRGKRAVARKISFLLENHPQVTFVEILRYRSAWQSEQEIREAVGRPLSPRSHDGGTTSPKLRPDGCLLH